MSSIVYLGLSLITFGIMYGVAFIMLPIILGSYFSAINPSLVHSNQAWLDMYTTHEETAKYLVPLMPSLTIFFIVLKVLLTASARGRD